MVVTDDDDVAEQVRLLRSHGMTSLTWDRHRGHASGYDVLALGFNYRIDEPRAALATQRLARLDADNGARRRDRRRATASALAGLDGIEPTDARAGSGAEPAHHLFTVVLDEGIDRDGFREALAERGSRPASTTRRPTASRSTPTAPPTCP